jgi:hypothetical protein
LELHEHGHDLLGLCVLLLSGLSVLFLHRESFGTDFLYCRLLSRVAGERARITILTCLESVGHVLAEFVLERFKFRLGDGAGIAANTRVFCLWVGDIVGRWEGRKFGGRLGIEYEMNLGLASVSGWLGN